MREQTAGIILAAGMSKRLGTPKQLLRFKGKYLLEHVLEAALASLLDSVFLVLGYESDRIAKALELQKAPSRLRKIVNPQYTEGMSRSLCSGLTAAQSFPSVMFLLGDQPLLDSGIINFLLYRFRESKKDICVPVYGNRRGNPVIFSQRFYRILGKIEGDIGAREVIASHEKDVLEVELSDPKIFTDIDTPEDLESLKRIDP